MPSMHSSSASSKKRPAPCPIACCKAFWRKTANVKLPCSFGSIQWCCSISHVGFLRVFPCLIKTWVPLKTQPNKPLLPTQTQCPKWRQLKPRLWIPLLAPQPATMVLKWLRTLVRQCMRIAARRTAHALRSKVNQAIGMPVAVAALQKRELQMFLQKPKAQLGTQVPKQLMWIQKLQALQILQVLTLPLQVISRNRVLMSPYWQISQMQTKQNKILRRAATAKEKHPKGRNLPKAV